MKLKILLVLLIAEAVLASQSNLNEGSIRIYMPRDVSISDTVITLGQVAIIRGEDQEIVNKAEKLQLGQFSTIGQKIVIDRNMVKSRVACENIEVSDLEITGAKETTVTQKHICIESSKLIEVAEIAMKNADKPASVSGWSTIRVPRDFSINSSSKNVEFQTSIIGSSVPSSVKVNIDIYVDGKKVATKTVVYRYQFSCRRAVAKIPIAAGAIISADNAKIETYQSTQPERADWESPYGLIARRRIPTNSVISNSMVAAEKSEVLVKRNDNVVVKIETPAMLLSAVGRVLEDGREGQCVKVRMNISGSYQRIIYARVKADGTLEPIS